VAAKSSIFSIIGKAFSATFSHLGVVLCVVLAYGLILASIDSLVYDAVVGSSGSDSTGYKQEDLIQLVLSWAGVNLAIEILLGPILAAVAVYVGRQHVLQRKDGSIYKAINFALSRYKRVFLPHMGAQVSIQVGMIIIVPGVLFLMQYAFVDAIACLEEEKSPLNRSKRLTRGRRKSIVLLFLPWLFLSQVIGFVDLWALSQSAWILIATKSAAVMVYFIMVVAFFMLYDERTRQKKKRKKAASPAPESEPSAT